MRQENSTSGGSATFDDDFLSRVVDMLKCKKHIWQREQQTDHEVCAWCNACNEPDCSHYRP
jgi:hypothetical protein